MAGPLNRRTFLVGFGLTLGGCAPQTAAPPSAALSPIVAPNYAPGYGPLVDNGNEIPGLDLSTIDPDLLRQEVSYAGPYRPGTIVVDVPQRRLYLVQGGGRALRYTVGVGRTEALDFHGSAIIGRKAEWPRWTPTQNMIEHMPRYAAYAGGMAGGIDNPLGARALYLYRNNSDTHFRLHGTNEPETIGQAVSSGCIRLFNHDIIDLYNRVAVGAPVVVLQSGFEAPGVADDGPAYDDAWSEAGPPAGPEPY